MEHHSQGATTASSSSWVLQSSLCASRTGRRIGLCTLELREDKEAERGFPGGTVVKNLPAKVGDSLEDPLV